MAYPELDTSIADIQLGPRAVEVLGVQPSFLRRCLSELEIDESMACMSTRSLYTIAKLVRPNPSLIVPWHFTKEGHKYLVSLTQDKEEPSAQIINEGTVCGSVFDVMNRVPSNIIQTVITSPPYWGARIYKELTPVEWSDGERCHFGGEASPESYVRHTLEILFKLKPIISNQGTVWWNIGDVYNTRTQIRGNAAERLMAMKNGDNVTWSSQAARRHSAGHEYLKDKDLCLIPQQIAIGAERLGYWVRSWITWDKENTMPETVKDRPTTSHEQILLLSKSKRYDFYLNAWKKAPMLNGRDKQTDTQQTSNLRTVWRFSTSSGGKGHGAQFPLELPIRAMLLSSKEGDIVMDPFLGAGTTGMAAHLLSRRFIGCDVVKSYVAEANKNISSIKLNGPRLEDFNGKKDVVVD